MALMKATAQPAPFKCTIYGDFGTGKTTFGMMLAEGLAKRRNGRPAVWDTEFGTKYLGVEIPARKFHPAAFDFDREVTRSLKTIYDGVVALDPSVHSCILIDSITHCWEAAREAWETANPGKDIALRDWGPLKKPYKALIKFLMDCPQDVIIVGRQKTLFEDENGKLKNVGVGMRAEGDTQFEPDFCFQMFSTGKRGDDSMPALFVEKDRSSILHGRTFPEPTFKTIEPILGILGTAALKMDEDDDERLARDGELLSVNEDKTAKKAEKSSALLAELQAKIGAAASVSALGEIAAEIKKQKRYLTEEHLGALRVYFDARRDSLVTATAGSV